MMLTLLFIDIVDGNVKPLATMMVSIAAFARADVKLENDITRIDKHCATSQVVQQTIIHKSGAIYLME